MTENPISYLIIFSDCKKEKLNNNNSLYLDIGIMKFLQSYRKFKFFLSFIIFFVGVYV